MRRVSAGGGPVTVPAWQGFFQDSKAHGFTVGDNLVADMLWVDEDPRGPSAAAADLFRSSPDLIVVEGPEAYLRAVLAVSRTVPIVITYGNYDPIDRGYVRSLAQPGGNITGVFVRQVEAAEKQVELAHGFPAGDRITLPPRTVCCRICSRPVLAPSCRSKMSALRSLVGAKRTTFACSEHYRF